MSSENVSPEAPIVEDPSVKTWDDVMAEYAPTEQTVTIELKNGTKIEIRIPYDGGELYSMEKQASDFVKACNKTPHDMWKPYLPQAAVVLKMVFKLSKLIISPPMNHLEGLKLAKTNGALLSYMYGKVMNASAGSIAETEGEMLEELGEG